MQTLSRHITYLSMLIWNVVCMFHDMVCAVVLYHLSLSLSACVVLSHSSHSSSKPTLISALALSNCITMEHLKKSRGCSKGIYHIKRTADMKAFNVSRTLRTPVGNSFASDLLREGLPALRRRGGAVFNFTVCKCSYIRSNDKHDAIYDACMCLCVTSNTNNIIIAVSSA